ncbi:MAG: hypothetical protein RIS35_1859 [Pseudomonadota bacterium]|jgi:hypothetical protein
MNMTPYLLAGLALLAGFTLGFFLFAIISSNKGEDPDAGRMSFLDSEPLHITRSGDYIVVFDSDKTQLAIGTDLRDVVDVAAMKLLAARVEAAEKAPATEEIRHAA